MKTDETNPWHWFLLAAERLKAAEAVYKQIGSSYSERLMKKSTAGKHKPKLNRIDVAYQRTALLELKRKAKDQSVRRMIDLALAGLETGVPRMTPEEITEYLGRNG